MAPSVLSMDPGIRTLVSSRPGASRPGAVETRGALAYIHPITNNERPAADGSVDRCRRRASTEHGTGRVRTLKPPEGRRAGR